LYVILKIAETGDYNSDTKCTHHRHSCYHYVLIYLYSELYVAASALASYMKKGSFPTVVE